MTDIYLVRHGETSGNVGKRHQPPHTRLTPRGREQAQLVGEQLQNVAPTHLFSSSHIRAVETASIVSESLHLNPETNQIFMELVRPEAMHGKKHMSLSSLWFTCKWFIGKGKGGGAVHGESRREFMTRLQAAKEFLESLPSDARVVVVTHSIFMNFFVDFVCHGTSGGRLRAAGVCIKILLTPNTAITKLKIEKRGAQIVWNLVS